MVTIYKYPFPIEDRFALDMPVGAKILKAECQGGMPCLWAMVDPGRAVASHRFRLCGTGLPIEDREASSLGHVGTFQQGPFVWHLFQIIQ